MKEQLKVESDNQLETPGQEQGEVVQEALQPDREARAEEAVVEDLSVDPYEFMQNELAKKGITLRRSPYRPGMEWGR